MSFTSSALGFLPAPSRAPPADIMKKFDYSYLYNEIE
jgi:hypothetical protein